MAMKIHRGGLIGNGPTITVWYEPGEERLAEADTEDYFKLDFNLNPITGKLSADIAEMDSDDSPGTLTARILCRAVKSVGGFEDDDGPVVTLDEDTALALPPKVLQYVALRIKSMLSLSIDEMGFFVQPSGGGLKDTTDDSGTGSVKTTDVN